MNIEKYFYCNSENCINYYAEMPDNVGCKAEDIGDIKGQYANECDENLPLCKCFAQRIIKKVTTKKAKNNHYPEQQTENYCLFCRGGGCIHCTPKNYL